MEGKENIAFNTNTVDSPYSILSQLVTKWDVLWNVRIIVCFETLRRVLKIFLIFFFQ